MKSKKTIISALDIGSAKILCLVAELSVNNDLKIIGIGHQLSQGFKAGIITDIKAAEASILSALYAAEKMSGEVIDRVSINLSDSIAKSHKVYSNVAITKGEPILDKDVKKVIAQSLQQVNKPGQEILHYFPLDYAIDGIKGIKDPRAMYGEQLSCTVNVLTATQSHLMNLANCLARCQVYIDEIMVSSYASSIACLTHDEMELGSIVIDLGSATSSFAIIRGGKALYTDYVPVGGSHITSDIALILSISLVDAERIKTLYGNALSSLVDKNAIIEDEFSDHYDSKESSVISKLYLSNIIQSRLEETFELINKKITDSGEDRANSKIVLTGGGSQMLGIKELAAQYFKRPVKIIAPKTLSVIGEQNNNSFATGVGILKFVANRAIYDKNQEENKNLGKKNFIKKLINWLQENF